MSSHPNSAIRIPHPRPSAKSAAAPPLFLIRDHSRNSRSILRSFAQTTACARAVVSDYRGPSAVSARLDCGHLLVLGAPHVNPPKLVQIFL